MMQVIDIQGDPYERGYIQGRKLRNRYADMMDAFYSSEIWQRTKPGFVPDSVVEFALRFLGTSKTRKAVKKHLPNMYERIQGLGEGFGIPRSFGWGIHFLEIMFCEAGKSLAAPTAGCTQLHATPGATVNGHPISARNYDFPNLLRKYQVVRREIPEEKNRLATTTVTQLPLAGAHQGVNEAGLLVCANNARLWKGKDLDSNGVPYLLILQEILETCTNVKDAVDLIVNFPARGNAGFFGIMDDTGDCRLVEFTASRAMTRKPDESGVLVQTNHYHAMKDANLPDGTYWAVKGMEKLEYATSTNTRFEYADRLLHEQAGNITTDSLKKILSNHDANDGVGNDNTICMHGESGSTLSSMILDGKTKTLYVAEGNPCENEFLEVPFRSRIENKNGVLAGASS